jgi:hypothetical protein
MKVFLSHSKKDLNLAKRIANDLMKNNIDVWIDDGEIFIGDSIITKVQQGLNSCDILSVLFTQNSLHSNWVEREWQSFLNKLINNKNILLLPIKGDSCELPLIIGDVKFADVSVNYNTAIKKLIESINNHRKSQNLINRIESTDKNISPKEIEVKFNLDFDNFTEEDRERVAKAISELIGANFNVKITNIRRGSVIVKFKLPDGIDMADFFKKLVKSTDSNVIIEDAWLADDSKVDPRSFKVEDIFKIEATPKSPAVYLNAKEGKGIIKGRVIPENSIEFFLPIIKWFDAFPLTVTNSFELNCYFEYFNTSSSKCIEDVLKKMEYLKKAGVNAIVNWYYEEDDEDMLEAGEDYESIIRVPFKLIEIKE